MQGGTCSARLTCGIYVIRFRAAGRKSDHALVCIAQLRELFETARARVGDRPAAADRDADLVVALQLRLGARRPHDDATATGELEHEDVRGRQPAFALAEVDDGIDREAGNVLRWRRAETRH